MIFCLQEKMLVTLFRHSGLQHVIYKHLINRHIILQTNAQPHKAHDWVNRKICLGSSPHPPMVPSDNHQIVLHGLYQGGNWYWDTSNDLNQEDETVLSRSWKPLIHYLKEWQTSLPKEYTTLALQPWETQALLPHTFNSSLLSSGTYYQQLCYCTPPLLVN